MDEKKDDLSLSVRKWYNPSINDNGFYHEINNYIYWQ